MMVAIVLGVIRAREWDGRNGGKEGGSLYGLADAKSAIISRVGLLMPAVADAFRFGSFRVHTW